MSEGQARAIFVLLYFVVAVGCAGYLDGWVGALATFCGILAITSHAEWLDVKRYGGTW